MPSAYHICPLCVFYFRESPKGQGQTSYTVYTLVKRQVACQIVMYQTDPLNTKVVTDAVNSFSWQ